MIGPNSIHPRVQVVAQTMIHLLRTSQKKLGPAPRIHWQFLKSRMSKKFGAGKQPTGTPSLGWSSVVAIVSLLAGASVVHSIYKPNLVTIFFFISHFASYSFFAHNLFDKMSNSSLLIFIFFQTLPPVESVDAAAKEKETGKK